MSSLFVLLPGTEAQAQAELPYVLSADGRSALRHASAAPALLPPISGTGAELVAIAPAAALSWHAVELPKGAGARGPKLRAVLEGLLEDRLLDEPENLHFALEPGAREGGKAWVAVCDRAWLRDALQALEQAGRPVSRVVPEFAPEGAPALHAIGEPEDPWLVASSADGVVVLPLATASLPLLPTLPPDTRVVAEPAVAGQAEQVLQQSPRLQPPPQRLLAAAGTRWDLAQFEFANSGRHRALKKLATGWGRLLRSPQWRPARWGAVLLVVVQLLGLNAWAWKERSSIAGKRETARTLLTQTFPQVRAVVDAPLQMEREVAALRQQAGGISARDLESMLSAVAAIAPGRPTSRIEYSAGELRLRGVVSDEAQGQPVVQGLRVQGYAASMQGDVLVIRTEAQP